MKRKDKKVCTTLIYTEDSFILASTIIGCISISAFLLRLVGVTSSAIRLKIFAVNAGIKKYKSIIKKKKHDKIVLLAKSKLNSIEVLISKASSDSSISHNEFLLINNLLKKYDDVKSLKA